MCWQRSLLLCDAFLPEAGTPFNLPIPLHFPSRQTVRGKGKVSIQLCQRNEHLLLFLSSRPFLMTRSI